MRCFVHLLQRCSCMLTRKFLRTFDNYMALRALKQRQLTPFFCKANVIAISLIGEQGPVENTTPGIINRNKSQQQITENQLLNTLVL